MATILSISYNESLLLTRQMLLQQMGHKVYSAEGFAKAFKFCESQSANVDLIVLGHSIPHDDKVAIIEQCTKICRCPVLALLRSGEGPIPGASKAIDSSDPEAFLTAINEIVNSTV